tara:strand:+ start:3922 stop:4149 length:228 start_codon:yes stop_codon:yes gene_type:complete
MPRRAQKKRAQRRQRDLENDINTNGVDNHRSGTFKVYDQKANKVVAKGLNWEQAVKVWNEHGKAIILTEQHRMGR